MSRGVDRHLIAFTLGCLSLACGGSGEGDRAEGTGGAGGSAVGGSGPAGGVGGNAAGAGGASGSSGSAAGGAAGGGLACGVPVDAGRHDVNLNSSGKERTARIHVPPGYDESTPAMLVLAFHGWTQNGDRLEEISQLSETSDAHGFLVVYPDGLGNSWNAGACCGTRGDGNDDVLFARDLVARVQSEYCVDSRRVYATGFSNGAMMSHRLGCEAADLFAAIAPVSGQIAVDSCAPSRPIPVWESQGTSDLILQFNGLGSLAETVAGWVARNACTDGAPGSTFQNAAATCNAYTQCLGGSVVEVCEISGAGHQWPGGVSTGPIGGALSNDLDASEALYQFFAAHPMPS